jgi:hypothetical protein
MENDKLGSQGDAFYNALMDAHDGLSESESHALNARLVLMLSNEIGDLEVFSSILRTAREFKSS